MSIDDVVVVRKRAKRRKVAEQVIDFVDLEEEPEVISSDEDPVPKVKSRPKRSKKKSIDIVDDVDSDDSSVKKTQKAAPKSRPKKYVFSSDEKAEDVNYKIASKRLDSISKFITEILPQSAALNVPKETLDEVYANGSLLTFVQKYLPCPVCKRQDALRTRTGKFGPFTTCSKPALNQPESQTDKKKTPLNKGGWCEGRLTFPTPKAQAVEALARCMVSGFKAGAEVWPALEVSLETGSELYVRPRIWLEELAPPPGLARFYGGGVVPEEVLSGVGRVLEEELGLERIVEEVSGRGLEVGREVVVGWKSRPDPATGVGGWGLVHDVVHVLRATEAKGGVFVLPPPASTVQALLNPPEFTLSSPLNPQLDVPKRLWEALMPFQKEGVEFLVKRGGRGLVGDEVGLGKTLQGLAVLGAYKEWPALVVCPASMRLVWARELERWLGDVVSPGEVAVVLGRNDLPGRMWGGDGDGKETQQLACKVVITSPQMVRELTPPPSVSTATAWQSTFRPGLFRMVVVDESHSSLRTTSTSTLPSDPGLPLGCSATAFAVQQLTLAACRRVLLTGTPSVTKPFDMHRQLVIAASNSCQCNNEDKPEHNCVKKFSCMSQSASPPTTYITDPIVFGQVYGRQVPLTSGGGFLLTPDGARRSAELACLMASPAGGVIRRFKKDLMAQLPSLRRVVVPLDVGSVTEGEVLKRAGEFKAGVDLQDGESGEVKSVVALSWERLGLAKVAAGWEWAKEKWGLGDADVVCADKVVFFSHHRSVHACLVSLMQASKVQFVSIEGSTPALDRAALCQKFATDTDVRVALLSITAAAVGLDLSAATSCVFFEPPPDAAWMTQAEGRVHRRRPGQVSETQIADCMRQVESYMLTIGRPSQWVSSSGLVQTETTLLKRLASQEGQVEDVVGQATWTAAAASQSGPLPALEDRKNFDMDGRHVDVDMDDLLFLLSSHTGRVHMHVHVRTYESEFPPSACDEYLAVSRLGVSFAADDPRPKSDFEGLLWESAMKFFAAAGELSSYQIRCIKNCLVPLPFPPALLTKSRPPTYVEDATLSSQRYTYGRTGQIEMDGCELVSVSVSRLIRGNTSTFPEVPMRVSDRRVLCLTCTTPTPTTLPLPPVFLPLSRKPSAAIEPPSTPKNGPASLVESSPSKFFASPMGSHIGATPTKSLPPATQLPPLTRRVSNVVGEKPTSCANSVHDDSALFCSGACRGKYFMVRGGGALRRLVKAMDRGVCASCKVDTHALLAELICLPESERTDRIVQRCSAAAGKKVLVSALARRATEDVAWHADHILPVWKGGGEAGLDNLQTLCVFCHADKTKVEAAERAALKGPVAVKRKRAKREVVEEVTDSSDTEEFTDDDESD